MKRETMIQLDKDGKQIRIKIVHKSRTDRFARIELREIQTDGKPRFLNPRVVMGASDRLTLPDGSVLKAYHSGGLYLEGRNSKGLQKLLEEKGYAVIDSTT